MGRPAGLMHGNPFLPWVERWAALLEDGAALTPARPPPSAPTRAWTRTAVIFAPHPDDEVIIGGLPLRLQRQAGFRVVDLAVTLGSRKDRREGRWAEAEAACAVLGFELVTPDRAGLDQISPAGRRADPANWRRAVDGCAALLAALRPEVVFLPHGADWNQTHLGVHALGLEALAAACRACVLVETEFWGAMTAPNMMVESSAGDVADLVGALALHVGEVARNPYHLRLPAWMADNVRRGAELVGGQGGAAPAFNFATLYRLRRWTGTAAEDVLPAGVVLAQNDDPAPTIEAGFRA